MYNSKHEGCFSGFVKVDEFVGHDVEVYKNHNCRYHSAWVWQFSLFDHNYRKFFIFYINTEIIGKIILEGNFWYLAIGEKFGFSVYVNIC